MVIKVRRPTLIFGPHPKLFYDNFSRKLFKYPNFALQCSFRFLRDHYFDKNLNVTLQMEKYTLDAEFFSEDRKRNTVNLVIFAVD